MSQRRVRSTGRPSYGRPVSLPPRRGKTPVRLGLLPRRLILLGLAGVGLLWIINFIFAINDVKVKSGPRAAEVKAETEKIVAGSWNQGNLLTFEESSFVGSLMKADPLIKSVDVHRRWTHGITLDVTLKQPSLGWSSGNQAYLLDRDGSIIGALAPGAGLPIIFDGSNLPVEVGKRVTSARFVTFATTLAQSLAGLGLASTRYEVKDTTLDMTVSTNKGYRIIFDTSRNPQEELNDLKSMLSYLAKQHKNPGEYIDLRIAGKAYYK